MKLLFKASSQICDLFMLHLQMTVDLIKRLMDIPVIRLKSIFIRYIKLRRFHRAKGI